MRCRVNTCFKDKSNDSGLCSEHQTEYFTYVAYKVEDYLLHKNKCSIHNCPLETTLNDRSLVCTYHSREFINAYPTQHRHTRIEDYIEYKNTSIISICAVVNCANGRLRNRLCDYHRAEFINEYCAQHLCSSIEDYIGYKNTITIPTCAIELCDRVVGNDVKLCDFHSREFLYSSCKIDDWIRFENIRLSNLNPNVMKRPMNNKTNKSTAALIYERTKKANKKIELDIKIANDLVYNQFIKLIEAAADLGRYQISRESLIHNIKNVAGYRLDTIFDMLSSEGFIIHKGFIMWDAPCLKERKE